MNTLKLLAITLFGIFAIGISGCAVETYSDYPTYDNPQPYYYGNPDYYQSEVVVTQRHHNHHFHHGVFVNP